VFAHPLLIVRRNIISLPGFSGVFYACDCSADGLEWEMYFKQANSGTYNNMWMVTDMKKFRPHRDLGAGLLTVCEQIPGLIKCADQTSTLARGYWFVIDFV
jgi:hypothetical protein